MSQTLRIVTWNANGLLQHIPELEIFLNTQNIDICLISESHFTKLSHARIRGYKFYRANHPAEKARGGSAIFIKENIKHYEELMIEKEIMQVTSINVQLKNRNINISAIYCPPRHNLKKEHYEELFKSLGPHFIIGGDFNAKNIYWGSRITTPKGRELFTAGRMAKCEFHSGGSPTYWPTDLSKLPDTIDFYVTKGVSDNYIHIENNEGLTSDHSPVIMTLSETVIQKVNPVRLTNKRTNWDLFRELAEKEINLQVPIQTPIQIEEELDRLTSTIQESAWQSTPLGHNVSIRPNNYPLEVRELVAKKRKARKSWQTNRTRENKLKLNNLCNKLKSLIKHVKNETVNRYLSVLNDQKDTEYSLWKATKALKRPKNHTAPIRNDDGTWARSDKQKADLFAKHLEETFQPLPRQTADENITPVARVDNIAIQTITLHELKEVINKQLNSRKAPGYDLITGQIIKELPDKAIRKLLHIINATFRLRHVPSQWKVAEVIMIPKPNKPPNDKKSYRPISILPTISKVFEKLLLKRMKPIIEERNLIPAHQFGFRQHHSTIEQVHRITNIIENTLETKKICSSIFLDVAQAFDRVWHKGLEYKLKRDLPRQYYEILKSYLSKRHFRVKYEEEYSDLKKISAGVPQGSVLGPVLYLLYTRDLPVTSNTSIATFADDTAIMAVGKNILEATNKLQKSIDAFSKWTKKWRIQLNESKSIHVNFTNQNVTWIPVNINSKQVPHANTAKYLGMTLDAKLRWKEHVKKKKEELNIKFRKMYWLLGRNSELSIKNKLLLYRQILKPVWTYGIQLWGCTKKTNVKIIQTFQNKALRCIVNAPWYIRNDDLHRDLKMDSISEVITNHAVKHDQRLRQHENTEIRRMLDNPWTVRRLQRTKPMDLVNVTN